MCVGFMKKKYDKVFHLNPESSPLGIRNVFVRSFVEHLTRLDKLNRIVCDGRAVEQRAGQCFSDRILDQQTKREQKVLMHFFVGANLAGFEGEMIVNI